MSVDSPTTDRRRRQGAAEEQRTVVRFARSGWAVGAGMLLASDVVATCAHVVAEVLGLDDIPEIAPQEALELDLPFLPGRPRRVAIVEGWAPPTMDGGGDVAILRLGEPVPVAPPTVRRLDDPWGDGFRVAGFPPGAEEGTWARGEFRRAQASGWLQLSDHDGGSVGPGFSGAPVWDDEHGCVAAMAVAADLADGGDAYAIPIERVLALAPELLVNPYCGLAALGESDTEFLFGRRDDLERSLHVLEHTGLLVLAGGSGSGKSSLLAAGVVPTVRGRGRQVATARLAGADSPDAVVDGVADALGAAGAELAVTWRARLRTLLDGGETDRLEHLRLILVIDQFEDLAALVPDTARAALELVVGLAGAGVHVAMTARWATFDDLRSEAAVADLQRSTLGITPLDRAGMRAAVAEPAARVPGPTFDAELVERIVDDAGDEPGRLPLVGALLAELWQTAGSGRVTVADYERVGEVKGALAASAERVWRSLGPSEQGDAAAVLQAMTRPTEAGFVRHPVVLAALRPGRRRVVERLAAERLVVVGPGPRGEVAELAHQALVDHWDRLRRWVEDDADFLRWRAQVRDPVDRWTSTHEPGALLRGADLETAVGWLHRREDDLEAAERDFVNAGADRQLRDRRLALSAIAVVVVLALVASVLAVVLGQRNGELGRSLSIANSRTLAELSAARLSTDVGAATQLALAAYAADPNGVPAHDALGQVYLARHSTVGEFVPPGPPTAMQAMTSDATTGTTLVAVPGGAIVIDGLGSADPRTTPVPGASATMFPAGVTPGGRFLVLRDQAGDTLVWDRTSSAPPRTLLLPRASVFPTPDGTHLLTTLPTPTGTEVRLDDLLTGATTPVLQLPEQRAVAFATSDPSRLLVRVPAPPTSLEDVARGIPAAPTLTVRDARSGAVLAAFDPTTVVADGGRLTVGCDELPAGRINNVLVVRDAATAVETHRVAASGTGPSCEPDSTMITADGRHLAWLDPGSSTDDGTGAVRAQIVDLENGGRSSMWAPRGVGLNAGLAGSPESAEGTGPRIRGTALLSVLGARAFLADGTALDVLAPSSVPSWRDLGVDRFDGLNASAGPGETYVLLTSVRARQIRVVDATNGRPLGSLDLAQAGFAPDETVTNFGNYDDQDIYEVTTLAPDGPRVHEYRLPTMTPLGTYDLGTAGAGGPRPQNGSSDTPDYPLQGRTPDRLVVLSSGVLSWWSTATHRLLAPPVTVTADPAVAHALVERNGGLTGVDPAADTVAFSDQQGVEQWTLGAPHPTVITAPLVDGFSDLQVDHGRLRTIEAPGALVSRDPGNGAADAPPAAVPGSSSLIGNDMAGDVLTADSAGSSTTTISFWDPVTLGSHGRLVLPLDLTREPNARNGEWQVDTDDDFLRFSLDAPTWRSAVCAVQDRPFTDAERALLPGGADDAAPCSQG